MSAVALTGTLSVVAGLGVLAAGSPVDAQIAVASPPEVRVRVDTSVATLGDRVGFEVAVAHQPEDSVLWPADTAAFGEFEVMGREPPVTTVRDGRALTTRRYTLAAFTLGELEIPSLPVVVTDPAGERRDSLRTAAVPVRIESVGLDQAGDIRDIKPPRAIALGWGTLLPWFLAIVVLGAVAWYAWRRWRRRDPPVVAPAPVAPARPPHEIALEAFDRLAASGLLERGEVKPYFSEASDILRRYLEGRFGIEAMELPSADILRALRERRAMGDVEGAYVDFFRRADLVKFAKHRPAPPVAAEIVEIGRDLVLASAPRPEPLPEPEPVLAAEEGS